MYDYFGQKANFPTAGYKSMNVQAEDFRRRMEPLRTVLNTKNFRAPHMQVFFYREQDRIVAWSWLSMSRN